MIPLGSQIVIIIHSPTKERTCLVEEGCAKVVIALILCGRGLIPRDVMRKPKCSVEEAAHSHLRRLAV